MSLKTLLFNCRGLTAKAELIELFANDHKVDLVCLTETWNTGTNTVFRKPLVNLTKENTELLGRTHHAGILIYLRNPSIPATVVETDRDKNWAIIMIRNLLIAVAYYPPSAPHSQFLEFLQHAEELAQQADQPLVVMGDFNARVKEMSGDHENNPRGLRLKEYLTNSSLKIQQSVKGTYTSCSGYGKGLGVTDLVLCRETAANQLQISEQESLGGSDHRPITMHLSTPGTLTKDYLRWNIRALQQEQVKLKYTETIDKMVSTTARRIRESKDVEQAWEIFKDMIEEAAEASCGKLRIRATVRERFLTRQLEDLLRRAHDLQKLRFNAFQDETVDAREMRQLHQDISEVERQICKEAKERRRELFHQHANELAIPKNASALLRILKCIKARKTNAGCKLDPNKINEHADHFKQTFGGQPEGREVTNLTQDAQNYTPLTITEDMVAAALRTTKPGKAAGIDGLMAELFKIKGNSMLVAMKALFQKCSDHAQTPSTWKQALIVPIFKKKGSDKEVKNYRPIALTCIARRIYERIIKTELLEAEKKLSDFQGGFRPRRQTLDQVFCLHEIIRRHEEVVVAFLDLKAAYDLVDRRILWTRMEMEYQVEKSTICRLRELFDHNESILVIDGLKSDPIDNKRGLLQGSSLSPLLFNFFIDSLFQEITAAPGIRKMVTAGTATNVLAFADDTSLHTSNVADMKKLLKICENWSMRMGMRFSPTKCFIINKGTKTWEDMATGRLELYDTALPRVYQADYLGIPFNSNGAMLELNVTRR